MVARAGRSGGGVTKFCVHPPHWRKEKKIIGGTKQFNLERIKALEPDLIIGNKEENYRQGIEALEKAFPVWMSDIQSLDEACAMMEGIGRITHTEVQAGEITAEIKSGFSSLNSPPSLNALYFIWRDPYMVAGGNTFIDEMLARCGFRNMAQEKARYPVLAKDEIRSIQPQLVLLSSEPYPFGEKHIQEIKNLCPKAEVLLVDGEMFCWYGSRLLKAVPYFKKLRNEIQSSLKLQL